MSVIDDRNFQAAAGDSGDEKPFVVVGMDHVEVKIPEKLPGQAGQFPVDGNQFAYRGPRGKFPIRRYIFDPVHIYATVNRAGSQVISENVDLMTGFR